MRLTVSPLPTMDVPMAFIEPIYPVPANFVDMPTNWLAGSD
jgi:hypothetical protein